MTTLLDAARQALPGCEWDPSAYGVELRLFGESFAVILKLADGEFFARALGNSVGKDTPEAAAQWLRAQVTARRDALDAALGEPKHLGLGAVEWAGMHRIAAARADAAEAKLKAVVASWPAHYHRQGCPWGACNCGADAANAARVEARRLCGVKDA